MADSLNIGVEVAKNALREVGRDDIAETIEGTRIPSTRWLIDHPFEDDDVVIRAFLLGHRALGHEAHRVIGVCCHTCWDLMAEKYAEHGVRKGAYPCLHA